MNLSFNQKLTIIIQYKDQFKFMFCNYTDSKQSPVQNLALVTCLWSRTDQNPWQATREENAHAAMRPKDSTEDSLDYTAHSKRGKQKGQATQRAALPPPSVSRGRKNRYTHRFSGSDYRELVLCNSKYWALNKRPPKVFTSPMGPVGENAELYFKQ